MPKNRYGATKRLKEIERKRKAQDKIDRRQSKNKPIDADEPEGADQREEGEGEGVEQQQQEGENLQ